MSSLADIYDGRVALNNVTTANAYTAANTLFRGRAVRINLTITGAAIYLQLGSGPAPAAVQWGKEVFMVPGLYSLERKFDAARVRSAAAGVPAQVTVEAAGEEDLGR